MVISFISAPADLGDLMFEDFAFGILTETFDIPTVFQFAIQQFELSVSALLALDFIVFIQLLCEIIPHLEHLTPLVTEFLHFLQIFFSSVALLRDSGILPYLLVFISSYKKILVPKKKRKEISNNKYANINLAKTNDRVSAD